MGQLNDDRLGCVETCYPLNVVLSIFVLILIDIHLIVQNTLIFRIQTAQYCWSFLHTIF